MTIKFDRENHCGNCAYASRADPENGLELVEDCELECRFYPPALVPNRHYGGFESAYPQVSSSGFDWCAQWSSREEKP